MKSRLRKQPLAGIRVIDLSRLLPGPYCTMILGDLGSDVIKVEEPIQGDYSRSLPPFYEGIGYWYLLFNRNKRSIAINLKTCVGRQAFYKLAKTADVVVESFRPGVASRLKVDYESVKKVKPSIIYCSITGYGQTGPYRLWVGHDINYSGVAGLLSMTGNPSEKPIIPGYPIADMGGGLLAAFGILVALRDRDINGVGQHLDISMCDLIASWSSTAIAEFFSTKKIPHRGMDLSTGFYPNYSIYETKDKKYITIGATEKRFWSYLCSKLKKPKLVEAYLPDRSKRKRIFRELQEVFKKKTREEWMRILDPEKIPVAPVLDVKEMIHDKHLRKRGLVWNLQSSSRGKIGQVSFPLGPRFTRKRNIRFPPRLGENTTEILRELGYSPRQIRILKKNGRIPSFDTTS